MQCTKAGFTGLEDNVSMGLQGHQQRESRQRAHLVEVHGEREFYGELLDERSRKLRYSHLEYRRECSARTPVAGASTRRTNLAG